ncbi:Hint domain-containing protein [Roseovarius sp. PS-C2]|uniref:Hint domain-containing protein n=1 Tax=Roseovarius sp. PS-C2 TaxID=2820814 RepID=UPI001C0C6B6A|nr:Hint domain-containing protein [Roseovarius sp. PS-C2]MBU3259152.1 Hint domain-containing protein [Roseovarius sp. PS-C2]
MSYAAAIPTPARTDRRYLTGICGEANVRTPLGPRRIEMLHPGDMIVTRDNGLQPIRMIWTRTVTAAQMRERPELAPIRLKPRAVGPMMPSRDLRIASGHRALIPGYRISGVADDQPCLMRIDGVAVASDAAFADMGADAVTFYNLVFDSHEVFNAEGLPVESYRPSPKALVQLDISTREALLEHFPNLARRRCPYPVTPHPTARARAYCVDVI